MADYRIKSHLDLDVKSAKSAYDAFKSQVENSHIKAKADFDTSGSKKSTEKYVKNHRKATQDLLNNELKDYKKHLDKQSQLEHKYINAKNNKTRKEIERQLRDNEKLIANEQKRLMESGNKNIGRAIQQMDKAFLNRGSSIQYLKNLKDVENGARKSLKVIEKLENDHTKKSVSQHKERYRNLLEGVRNNKFTDANLSSYSRELNWLDKQVGKVTELDKATSEYNKTLNSLREISKNTSDSIFRKDIDGLISGLESEKAKVFKKDSIDSQITGMRTLANTTNDVNRSLSRLSVNERNTASDIVKNAIKRKNLNERLIDSLDKKARKHSTLPSQYDEGSRAKQFANKYLSDDRLAGMTKQQYGGNLSTISEERYRKANHYLDNVKKKTQELHRLEKSNNHLYEKRMQTLSGYADSPLNFLAQGTMRRLNDGFKATQTDSLSKAVSHSRDFKTAISDANLELRQLSRADALVSRLNGLEGYLSNKQLNTFNEKFANIMKSGEYGTQKFDRSLTNLNRKVTQANKFKAFSFDMKDAIIGSSLGYMTGFMARRAIGGAYETYKDIDSAMTDMIKVADEADVNTTGKLKNISKKAFQIAKDTGTSTADIIRATATSIQSGMGSMEASIAVARKSAILANVGDMSQQDATMAVNTMVKSFNLDPLKKTQVNVKGVKKTTNELSEALDLLNHSG